MKITNIFKHTTLLLASLLFFSCSDFLNVMPDNRVELDTEDELVKLMVSGYPQYTYLIANEFLSDNIDQIAILSPNTTRLIEQIYEWQEVTESGYGGPDLIWQASYGAIAVANQVLEVVAELEANGTLTDVGVAVKGEALLSRAYNHFNLVNIFSQAYCPGFSTTDIGIPYITEPETTLDPKYDRGTVDEVYKMIEADIEAGLPLINNSIYTVQKYHFNKRAAYAFAARFYLFYRKYDKAITAATTMLGDSPETLMRDNEANALVPLFSGDGQTTLRAMDYIDSDHACNLMMLTDYTDISCAFLPMSLYTEHTHGTLLTSTETISAATAPWATTPYYELYSLPATYSGSDFDKSFAWRLNYLFEYTDPVNLIGYPHTVFPAFTTEETLLCRAEAYAMTSQYDSALSDMNLWVSKYVESGFRTMTASNLEAWVSSTNEHTSANPTTIKKFDPTVFSFTDKTQEALMYAVTHLRRAETIHLGLRWYDIKRFGITVERRIVKDGSTVVARTIPNVLTARDPRCAVQLPADVISAGLEANPR